MRGYRVKEIVSIPSLVGPSWRRKSEWYDSDDYGPRTVCKLIDNDIILVGVIESPNFTIIFR